MHRILIVDEDEHLLWALEKNLFPERNDLVVVTASTGEEGMEILKGGDVDLLVSDIKMPGKVDGFQLILRAKEIAPDARVVIMTAFGSGRVESFADRMGITHYIEKPFNISELRDMALDLLDEKEGFQGMLSDLELTDIIQMLCLAKRTTLLHLKHKDHRGKIVFDRGDVVHAEFDQEDGAEAVYRMLVLRQGDIFMESDVDYSERTIHSGWQDLLLEAVKRADEMRLEEGSQADEDGSGDSTPFSSFRPSESAEIDLKQVEDEEVDPEAELGEDHTDRLSGDSFFTEEELEEIGMASSEAIEESDVFDTPGEPEMVEESEAEAGLEESSISEAGLEESSISEAELEESSVSEAEETPDADRAPEYDAFDGADVAADGGRPVTEADLAEEDLVDERLADEGSLDEDLVDEDLVDENLVDQNLGDETSGPEVHDEGAPISAIAVLEDFVDECARLRVTGLTGPGEDAEATFVETSQAGTHKPDEVSAKMLAVVDCARRVASALESDAAANEIQLTLSDALIVVRRLEGTERFHFAVVGRDASLGVVLVLMRQFARRLAAALKARSTD